MTCGIYLLTNKINGKVYVGQSVNIERRWREYRRKVSAAQRRLYRAFEKYGVSAFAFEVIEECAPEHLDAYEDVYIRTFKATARDSGYNIRITASGRGALSQETRQRLSESKKGTPGAIAFGKLNDARRGVPMTEERRAKCSRVGRPWTEEMRAKLSGRKRTTEFCLKMKELHKGKPKSEEHKKSLSAVNTNHDRDARIKADLAMGQTVKHIAEAEGVHVQSIYQILDRFERDGVMVSHMLAASHRPIPVGPWHTIEMFT